ncbi:DUF3987 domain-containing protein [Faecalibacter sp. LW9]|uniref:DUF3987 domain-containing protein n=1 Tax=Faecalibacter sp. LW9 TaxID=3103144 RepID=UPI002AFF6272|nr:DUF3987 domain-containing protein [Faecalibacter sp. LW9]
MTRVSIFQNFNNPVQIITLQDLISNIKTGTYKEDVNTIRMAIGMGKPERADELKKNLLAFTPSATYSGGRKKEFIQEYNQIIHLDFDKIDEEDLLQITTQTSSIPYTLSCFKSPSGNGLKVFIQVDSLLQHHDLAYKQVQEYYERQLGINADPKCKDVTRLCFVSFDEDAYYNPLATIFAVDTKVEEKVVNQSVQMTSNNTDDVFQYCVEFTNKIIQFEKGNRNNYVYQLACNLNRKGVNQLDAEQFILQNFHHENQKEFIKSIESAYRNQAHEFGKFAKTAKFVNLQKDSPPDKEPVYDEVDYLKTTPTIPAHIVNYLPELLIEGCEAFKDNERKRDVFLTAGLTILSGCLPNVTGIYHQERVYPHLFSFIIAPAASGKGVLKNAKRLGDKIHERFVNKSNEAKKAFEIENAEYKTMLAKRKKDDAIPEKPVEPKFNLLFLPADTSQAMMMKMLQDNDGKGIICETEADAMSGANKQDWGNYSHIMRAAFHHEKISAARKTNNELLEIPNPQLAVSLSGTPAQVPKLIQSAEDGLFSRFMFYAFKNEIIWQDPSPKKGGIIFNDHFEKLSNDVLQVYDFLEQHPTEVQLTPDQWEQLNIVFSKLLINTVLFNSDDTSSIVFRLGLVLYRFCMIFTALRKVENGDCSEVVVCTDEDFLAALELINVYLNHSILMFNNLASQSEPITYKMGNNKKAFYEALPQSFQRKEAIELGTNYNLSERSVDNFLSNSVPELFFKPKTGWYEKK